MSIVNVSQPKTQLSRLLARVEAGERGYDRPSGSTGGTARCVRTQG